MSIVLYYFCPLTFPLFQHTSTVSAQMNLIPFSDKGIRKKKKFDIFLKKIFFKSIENKETSKDSAFLIVILDKFDTF